MGDDFRVESPPELAALLSRLEEAEGDTVVQEAAKDVAPAVTRYLVEAAQADGRGGKFASGWLAQPGGTGLEVTNSFGPARYVEFDTRPHVIEPKRAKTLAWMAGRGPFSAVFVKASTKAAAPWVYAKKVNHPGTKGKNILGKVMETTGADAVFKALAAAARRALGGADAATGPTKH